MTFPPDPEREPRRAAAWAEIRLLTSDGQPIELDVLTAEVALKADVQPKTVASLVSTAKRQGYARFERRATPADPWRVQFDFDACLVCGSPRSAVEGRTVAGAVDTSATAFVARARGALGVQGWLDAASVLGLVAALAPIEPEELLAAAVEFRPSIEHSFKTVVAFLDETRLVELDVTTDPNKVYYVMVPDAS